MRTKSNRKRNKSHRLPHSSIRRNKRTRSAKITQIRNDPHFILPRIDNESISSLTSNSNSNYNRDSFSRLSSKNPSNSSSETSTLILDIPDDGNARGKRRTRKNRKGRKGRRSQRGGTCYGRGVGANSYDPNFSIYNTRELQLFPYKPTN
jgi:hypothetical protein